MQRQLLGALAASIATVPVAVAANVVFPLDAAIIDVIQPPYDADPSDATPENPHDDTAAIQQALIDHAGDDKIIYLPNGVYNISDTLAWSGGQKRNILQGQSRDGTIIKVFDNQAGFDNAASPKAVINTGFAPAQRFRNAIRNLTVNTGSGNLGAIGIQFISNNQGGIRSVKIESGDGEGVIGLDHNYTGEIGPAFMKDIEIVGFNVGVDCKALHSLTFENLTLRDQKVLGFFNEKNLVIFRNLVSDNAVTAIENDSTGAAMVVIDGAILRGQSGSVPAIVNGLNFYGRNIDITRYGGVTIDNLDPALADVMGDIDEQGYTSEEVETLFANSGLYSLNLPVKETPEIPLDQDFDRWANPLDFGAWGDGIHDDSAAIQAAIDKPGITTVYLPNNMPGPEKIASLTSGDWVRYDDVDLTGVTQIIARASRGREGVGQVEIRTGSQTGAIIGTFEIPETGEWKSFNRFSAEITPTDGLQTVFLRGADPSGAAAEFDYLELVTPNAARRIEAEEFDDSFSVTVRELPALVFRLSDVELRGDVERLIGTEGKVVGGAIRLVDAAGSPDTVVVERIRNVDEHTTLT